MQITDEMVQRFKDIYKEEHNKEISDDEAREASRNLVGYVDLVYKFAVKESQLKRRLKKEPDGFPLDSSYSCLVCGNTANQQNGWHSWFGNTCLICLRAIKDGSVPTFVCTHRDSYYSMWHMKDRFNLSHQTVKKFIREGKIKARMVMHENGKVYEYIFLKKENPELARCDPERISPARKSYNKYRDKRDRIWSREKAKEWKDEFSKKHS